MQCHFDDGWNDPHQEGLQDCLLDRFNLCGKNMSADSTAAAQASGATRAAAADWRWYEFILCAYRNRPETIVIDDNQKAFDATVSYCAGVAGLDFKTLSTCALGDQGVDLLEASHKVERELNPNKSPDTHGHPTWVMVDGTQYANSSEWLPQICSGIGDSLTGDLAAACKRPDVVCPADTTACLGIPGKKLCCTATEYCVPGVGCTC